MRILLLLTLIVFSGCDQLSSKFKTPGTDPKPLEKPLKCAIDFQESCWSKTVKQITQCIKTNQGIDKFSASKEHCFNDSGKFIFFKNSSELFSKPFNPLLSEFSFSFSGNQVDECFNVEGIGSNYKIVVKGFEENPLEVATDGKTFRFSCLDGQKVVVDKELTNDCEKLNGYFSIPGIHFGPFTENGQVKGWNMIFKGAENTQEVFRCYYQ